MKEAYFTPENIDEKAREWLRELARFRERHVPDFHPESSALLVIDMQRYFIDEDSHAYVPSVAAIVPRLRDLLNSFIANGLPVIFTRHIDIDGEENTMIKWWDGAIKEDDEKSGLIPDLLHPDAIVIRKLIAFFLWTELRPTMPIFTGPHCSILHTGLLCPFFAVSCKRN